MSVYHLASAEQVKKGALSYHFAPLNFNFLTCPYQPDVETFSTSTKEPHALIGFAPRISTIKVVTAVINSIAVQASLFDIVSYFHRLGQTH